MDKRYWFCRKCKQQWNPMLNSTSRICPHCGHKVTIREDSGIEFFGLLGYKDYGVILLILAIVFIVGFRIGQNSSAFRSHTDKITKEVQQQLTSKKSDATISPDTDAQARQLQKNIDRTKASNDAALTDAANKIMTEENSKKYMQRSDSQRKRLEEETYQKIHNEMQQKGK